MKKSQKLVLVAAGLSLGACSSTDEKNTFLTYNDLQGKVLSHDEQWQTVQDKLDRIDALEVEVASLKQDETGETILENTIIDKDSLTSSVTSDETIMKVSEIVSSEETVIVSDEASAVSTAPVLFEDYSVDNRYSDDLVASQTAAKESIESDVSAATSVAESKLSQVQTTLKAETVETEKYEYGVQVASYSSRSEAIRGWNVLNQAYSTSFQGLEPLVNQKEVNGRTMYQLKVGPFVNKPFSRDFCEMLKEKGKDCYVSEYNGEAFTEN